jgi:serine/threonine protein phosphatase PrpC
LKTEETVIRITRDHKCEDPEERKIIRAKGGSMKIRKGSVWRVIEPDGTHGLAPSRTFGDIDWKEPKEVLPSEPETYRIPIDPMDEFLVMATDGLWDGVTDDIAGKRLCNFRADPNFDPAQSAEILVKEARKRGSLDDITCLVLLFQKKTLKEAK